MTTRLNITDSDTVIKVPRRVAKCPVCGASCKVTVDNFDQGIRNLYRATLEGVNLQCSATYKEGTRGWVEHQGERREHWWVLERKVIRWLDNHYRFTFKKPRAVEANVRAFVTVADDVDQETLKALAVMLKSVYDNFDKIYQE